MSKLYNWFESYGFFSLLLLGALCYFVQDHFTKVFLICLVIALYVLMIVVGYLSKIPEDFRKTYKAAKAGYAPAQFALGVMYLKGQLVTKNDSKAFHWFRKAAEQGFDKAQFYLGEAYFMGKFIAKDIGKATEWYRKAAEKGNADAQNSLGVMIYRTSCAQNNAISSSIPTQQAAEEALHWFHKSALQDNAIANYNLGILYRNGSCGNKDPVQAFKCIKKAAEQRIAPAIYELGNFYARGYGVERNEIEAINQYRKFAVSYIDKTFNSEHYNRPIAITDWGMEDDGGAIAKHAIFLYERNL